MSDKSKLIDELLDTLIQSPERPEEIQVCPICGGELHVGFGAYERFGEDLFGATVDCKSCGFRMAVDYAIPPPPWLKIKKRKGNQ